VDGGVAVEGGVDGVGVAGEDELLQPAATSAAENENATRSREYMRSVLSKLCMTTHAEDDSTSVRDRWAAIMEIE